MPLQPSRRDVLSPPTRDRDVTNLASIVRHQGSYLRSLDPGMLGGRFATPQPVDGGPTLLVGDGDGPGESDSVIGEDEDRLALTTLDTQVWRLIADPVWETIVVRWHPAGGAGVEWKRGQHYDISEDDNVVTISAESLANARAQVGDIFSAQYLRQDGVDEFNDPATVALRGFVHQYSTVPGLSSRPLPVETLVGDLIVVTGIGAPAAGFGVTDSRLTFLGNNMWIGFATDLSDIACHATSAPGGYWSISVSTFITNASGWTAAAATSNLSMTASDALALLSVDTASAAIVTLTSTHSVVDGSFSLPVGWTNGGSNSGNGKRSSRVDFWDNSSIVAASPVGPAAFHGGHGQGYATVVGLVGP